MKIVYAPRFARSYKKLPLGMKRSAEKAEKLFRKNPFDPRLHTHKLHGRLSAFWSFSITSGHRIIFEFGDEGVVFFHAVGAHGVYEL